MVNLSLSQFFEQVVKQLTRRSVRFALAGGMAASVYRAEARLTHDLDFLIGVESKTDKEVMAIFKGFALSPHYIRKAQLEGGPMFAIKRKSTPVYIIAGRSEEGKTPMGLDFILPTMPWSERALARAQHNTIDFGFGSLPCVTLEDMILSKLYALKNDQKRFNDLDDLKSIFGAFHPIDLAYLCSQMEALSLSLPESIYEFAGRAISTISKKISRKHRTRMGIGSR
jgi:hypothetical protein